MHPEAMCGKSSNMVRTWASARRRCRPRSLCDEKGNLIDGDDIMAIAALEMLAEKSLVKKTLVSRRGRSPAPTCHPTLPANG